MGKSRCAVVEEREILPGIYNRQTDREGQQRTREERETHVHFLRVCVANCRASGSSLAQVN